MAWIYYRSLAKESELHYLSNSQLTNLPLMPACLIIVWLFVVICDII